MLRISKIVAPALALAWLCGPAFADASNLYPGVTINQLQHRAPVHWVSIEQIAATIG